MTVENIDIIDWDSPQNEMTVEEIDIIDWDFPTELSDCADTECGVAGHDPLPYLSSGRAAAVLHCQLAVWWRGCMELGSGAITGLGSGVITAGGGDDG